MNSIRETRRATGVRKRRQAYDKGGEKGKRRGRGEERGVTRR